MVLEITFLYENAHLNMIFRDLLFVKTSTRQGTAEEDFFCLSGFRAKYRVLV